MYSALFSGVMRLYLVLSDTSRPLALGVLNGISAAIRDSSGMSLMHIKPAENKYLYTQVAAYHNHTSTDILLEPIQSGKITAFDVRYPNVQSTRTSICHHPVTPQETVD